MVGKMYLVVGVVQSGSGSLTWPEDFDVVGVFDDEGEAHKDAFERNVKSGFEFDEDGDEVQDDDLCDEIKYEVVDIDHFPPSR